jgi:hypothetical protein
MKRFILAIFFTLWIIPDISFAGVLGPASVRFLEGNVMLRTPDSGEWMSVSVNTPVDEGDAVWCDEASKAELQLPDGTIVRLSGGSQLDLIANDDAFIHLHLASGRIYLKTSTDTVQIPLQIDADDTTVLPESRTRLNIDMLPNAQEDVSIFNGAAYVEGNGNRTRVRAGEHMSLEEGHSELLSLNPPDQWESWNLNRDKAQSNSGKTNTYLPDELRVYSSTLDTNGRWVSVPEYGMVWRPTVILHDDWAPYRSGRWIWKGDDYVWISSENWGWIPYHYGRWAVIPGLGWCWVPPSRGDVYWGPGYVGWYSTGSHVGWTPLGPGEVFYGRGYHGKHSVNISNANIAATSVTFRNSGVSGGLTVVRQNDFLQGRHSPPNTSVSLSASLGSPRIQALRETRTPAIIRQSIPHAPPPQVQHNDTRNLRNRFPRVNLVRDKMRPNQQQPQSVPSQQSTTIKEKRLVHPVAAPPSAENRQGRPMQEPTSLKQEPPLHRGGGDRRGDASTPQQTTTHQKSEQHRQDSKPGEIKQKRVWKVTTPSEK